mmetsp:Transcript_9967/g.14906  ORF Transcript_9967/g.14906 Transcript_9967/m.14906 type:complete len:102 (-) Transcript_9967:769-1074(-)
MDDNDVADSMLTCLLKLLILNLRTQLDHSAIGNIIQDGIQENFIGFLRYFILICNHLGELTHWASMLFHPLKNRHIPGEHGVLAGSFIPRTTPASQELNDV